MSFGPGAGPAEALGPGLLISLCVTWGRPVRYAVGALFALTGLAAPFAPPWAQRASVPGTAAPAGAAVAQPECT